MCHGLDSVTACLADPHHHDAVPGHTALDLHAYQVLDAVYAGRRIERYQTSLQAHPWQTEAVDSQVRTWVQ